MCPLTQADALLTVKAFPYVRLCNGVNSYVFPDNLNPQLTTGSMQGGKGYNNKQEDDYSGDDL